MHDDKTATLTFGQIDGITCGPTALYAAWYLQHTRDVVVPDNVVSQIELLASVMGTNMAHGTTDKEMAKGLSFLGLTVQRGVTGVPVTGDKDHVTDDELKTSIEALKSCLGDGNVVLLRTSWYGMKHWVLALAFSPDTSVVWLYEPAAGRVMPVFYEDVMTFWGMRGFDSFVVPKTFPRWRLHANSAFPLAPVGYVGWSRNKGGIFRSPEKAHV